MYKPYDVKSQSGVKNSAAALSLKITLTRIRSPQNLKNWLTLKNGYPLARFGRYESETFRVDAQDLCAQRLEGIVFPKNCQKSKYWPLK